MKIGFFGGSFDPIHFGHINLALELAEKHALDEVLFCPAGLSPHKNDAPPHAGATHRKAMVEMAIAAISHFAFCDLEIEKKSPCFTVDTIRILKEQKPDAQLFLILGEDALGRLQEWKNIEELTALAMPLVGTRNLGNKATHLTEPLKSRALQGMTSIPLMDISSTNLRKRLGQRLYCGHLIPANVLDYIYANKLYSSP